ncbi:cobyrinate a,c-diamide synthase [Denitrobaculum tricleocarpae]|uniref:cobyrinate a,c-diamide synthase n=1 Tax=Denitrobaculum tricleocarpae TaxID=2591009 RepID=UPI00319E90C2
MDNRIPPGLLIAAPSSGSGKTSITLALLRRFRQLKRSVASIKVGPDYIDPAFHAAASGQACTSLDSWAMRESSVMQLLETAGERAEFVLGEGVMGLFDGAPDGRGSTADLALMTGWPVVLVIDARGMAASAAAILHGFKTFDPRVSIAGVIFNRVGSDRHAAMLAKACGPLDVPLLGMVRNASHLQLPSRHLGLIQANEHEALESFLEAAACDIAGEIDCDRLAVSASARLCKERGGGVSGASRSRQPGLKPFGQRIAVARDTAFAFSYPFLLDAWRTAGAEISLFSPLADEAPDLTADAVYLPGGYPELHAGRLAGNRSFMTGLEESARRGACVYGECGGYMVLGEGLTDAQGVRHAMAGLLPLETSFAPEKTGKPGRRMVLGYRQAALLQDTAIGMAGEGFRGHEFHYARELSVDEPTTPVRAVRPGDRLFGLKDAQGQDLADAGLVRGNVMGSFLHIIDTV